MQYVARQLLLVRLRGFYNRDNIIYISLRIPAFSTVAKIDATPYRTTAVSIHLVSADNPHMHISNSLKTQRNNRATP